ncbi:putative Ulp1 protease family catalytic domain, papain-like cysteine peptidase superfamily [Helianthus annuus]|nr:putative Ulp1 protease family catalytic domain, papain-like cysteine peptidase superfamily [Helianthus annuus]
MFLTQFIVSDDDFVDPQPRVNLTKNQKKEKAESKPKRSQRKDKTKEQPEQQPYYDYDGKKINIRCAVNNLKDYIEGLSKEQRNVVREIGFESILKFKLHSVPRKFGYWLVKNFDAENDEINIGDEKIKITAEFIQKVFQIPNGKTEIVEKLRPKDTDLIIKFWRGQFPKDILQRMYAHNLITYLKSRNELGRLFKLNFLVIFFTIMAEAMQSSNVNQRFLPSMKSDKKTQNFNWCEYMLTVLKRTRRQWPGNEKLFNGPIALLAILYAYKKQGFDDTENTEEFSLDKIDSTTLQEFEDELEIAAQNDGRCLVNDKVKKVRKTKQKKKDEKNEFYVYPSESENENEEIFEDESEEKHEDDAEEQPISLLKAATDWIDQENQENVQNSQIITNETEKTNTESGGSWGQFFIKPSVGNKDKMWVDSQSRLRNFIPSQNQSEGLSDIHSTKSGDENMKNIKDKKSHEEYLVTALDQHFKGIEEVFESIQSRIDEIVEENPTSEALHNKVNEWVSLIEKFHHQAKKHQKVNIDSTMIETPSRFLNLSQNEDTENQIISTPLIVKRNDDDTKHNEDSSPLVQSSNPETISENEPASVLQTHIEKPSMVQSSFSEETPSLMLEIIKKTDEEEKKSNLKKFNDDEVPSFDLKISQLPSNVDENEVEVDATGHGEQTEIQAESEKKTIEQDVQITGIQTMFDRIEEQDTEKEISDLLQNTSFLHPQEDQYKTPAKSVHQEQPTTDISKTEEIITKMVRPDREKNVPEVFCSPYYLRQVAMKESRTAHENNISGYAFHAKGEMMDILFEIKEHAFLYRYAAETMRPGLEITGEVINCWSYILNEEEKRRSKDNKSPRFFCTIRMLALPNCDKEEFENKGKMIKAFTMNIEKILQGAKLKSIKDFKIILVPILHIQHFFVISFNLEEKQIFIIDNIAKEETNESKYGNVPENTRDALAAYLKSVGHEKADDIKGIIPVRMQMKWRTQHNGIDCGIFTMRHMECYKGEPVEKWDCGFNVEYEVPANIKKVKNKKPVNKQTAQLEDLRRKFIAKILLHEINEQRDYVIEDSKTFRDLSAKLKKQSYETSLDRIKDRLALAGLL